MAMLRKLAAQLMRLVPGSKADRLVRYWRDLNRLERADVALVSFPKSGRTFVRVMLARLYQIQFGIDDREALNFATLESAPESVPRILFTHNGNAMRRPSEIRLNRRVYEGRKVVLLARHPGDVAVSRYFHLKHRSHDPARHRLAAQPLEDFVWTPHGGIPSIVRYLNQWAELSRERSNIHIVRYEDFLTEPERTLSALAHFIGLDSDETDIKDAVEFARFDNLRERERAGYFTSSRFGAGKTGTEESYKVRSGTSGGFRKQLSMDIQQRVQSFVREQLDPLFGYGS